MHVQARAEPERDVGRAPERQVQLVAELPVRQVGRAQELLVQPAAPVRELLGRARVVLRARVLVLAPEVPRELRALPRERALVRVAQLAWALARVRPPAYQVEEARRVRP